MYVWVVRPFQRIPTLATSAFWTKEGFYRRDAEELAVPLVVKQPNKLQNTLRVAPKDLKIVVLETPHIEELEAGVGEFVRFLDDHGVTRTKVIHGDIPTTGVPWNHNWLWVKTFDRFQQSFLDLWGSNAPFIEEDPLCVAWKRTLNLDEAVFLGSPVAPQVTAPAGRFLICEFGAYRLDERDHVTVLYSHIPTTLRIFHTLKKLNGLPINPFQRIAQRLR